MLEYEGWGNTSQMILTNSEEVPDPDHHNSTHQHEIDIFNTTSDSHNDTNGTASAQSLDYPHHFSNNTFTQHHLIFNNQTSNELQRHTLYDPRPFSSSSAYNQFHNIPNNSAHAPSTCSYFLAPKVEEDSIVSQQVGGTRIGLNLGHRTYFSAQDDDFVNRLYRRSRSGAEMDGGGLVNSPRCQAEGCAADLSNAKHYHRRHKVCEFHSKAATVIAGGLTQRFCQQCSRFHLLTEFDNGKRSCRKRLADHNRRRRKTPLLPSPSSGGQFELPKSPPVETSFNYLESPPESSAVKHLSPSSVTIALSPPRMSLEYYCFRHGSYRGMASTSSSNSVYYSN